MYIQNKILFSIVLMILIICVCFYFKNLYIIYFLYLFFSNKKLKFFLFCNIILFFVSPFFMVKNILFYVLYQIILTLSHFYNTYDRKKTEYRSFLLTFFIYLVLINIFESFTFSIIQIIRAMIIYVLMVIICKLNLKIIKL